jgi:hypothetical protein
MFPQLTEQNLFTLSTIQLHPLGTKFPADNGRKMYKYVAFGGTATISPGLLLVAPAAPSNSTGLALDPSNLTANLVINSPYKTIFVTNGATAVTTSQFTDGTIEFVGTNGNFSRRIAGNSAAAASGIITVTLAEPIGNTLGALVVGTNTVNLRQNPSYLPTASLTQAEAVGVTIMSVPNTASVTNYGWVQCGGDAVAFATSATKGDGLTQDLSGTAGYFINDAASATPALGVAQESVVSSLATVNLNIA